MTRRDQATTRVTVMQYRGDEATAADDALAVEEPLEIRLGDKPLAITMRTPGGSGTSIANDNALAPNTLAIGNPWGNVGGVGGVGTVGGEDGELAAGFCWTEGLIEHPDELVHVEPDQVADYGNVVRVTLTDEAMQRRAQRIACATREQYLSSSCGLCGKQSIDRLHQHVRPIAGDFTVTREVIHGLPSRMRQAQSAFDQTGGLHAAGLFSNIGELRVLREDIGRHNAVDKVIGHQLLLGRMPLDSADAGILLVSGRSSFEIMQKAAMAGIPIVCAISAPSSMAVATAAAFDMTLIGFLRDDRMNVYHDRQERPRLA